MAKADDRVQSPTSSECAPKQKFLFSIKWLVLAAAVVSIGVSFAGGLVMYFNGRDALSRLIEDCARSDLRNIAHISEESFLQAQQGVDRAELFITLHDFANIDSFIEWARVEAIASTFHMRLAGFGIFVSNTTDHTETYARNTRGEMVIKTDVVTLLSINSSVASAECMHPCAQRYVVDRETHQYSTNGSVASLAGLFGGLGEAAEGGDWRKDAGGAQYVKHVTAPWLPPPMQAIIAGLVMQNPWRHDKGSVNTKALVVLAELHLGDASRVWDENLDQYTAGLEMQACSSEGRPCVHTLAHLPDKVQSLIRVLNGTEEDTFTNSNGYWIVRRRIFTAAGRESNIGDVYAFWFRSEDDVHAELNTALAVFVVFVLIVFLFEISLFFVEVYMVASPLVQLAQSTRELRVLNLSVAATGVFNVNTHIEEVESLRKGLLIAISQLVEYKTFLPQQLFLEKKQSPRKKPQSKEMFLDTTAVSITLPNVPDKGDVNSVAVPFSPPSPEHSPGATSVRSLQELNQSPQQMDDEVHIDEAVPVPVNSVSAAGSPRGIQRQGTHSRLVMSSVRESVSANAFELHAGGSASSSECRTPNTPRSIASELKRTPSTLSRAVGLPQDLPVSQVMRSEKQKPDRTDRVPQRSIRAMFKPPHPMKARKEKEKEKEKEDLRQASGLSRHTAEEGLYEEITLTVEGRGSGPLRSECQVSLHYSYVTTMTVKLSYLEQNMKRQTQQQFLEAFSEAVGALEGITSRHKGTLLPFSGMDCCLMTLSWMDTSPDRACRAAIEVRDTFKKVGVAIVSSHRSSGIIGSQTYRNFAFMPSNDSHLLQAIHGLASYAATLTCSSVILIAKETAAKIQRKFEVPFVACLRYCSTLCIPVAELVREKSGRADKLGGFMVDEKPPSKLPEFVHKMATGSNLSTEDLATLRTESAGDDGTYDSRLTDFGNIMLQRIRRLDGNAKRFMIEYQSSSLTSATD